MLLRAPEQAQVAYGDAVTESSWKTARWMPALMMLLLGLVSALSRWSQGGPNGCVWFVMADFDNVDQVGRSWFPPSVTCRFTYSDSVGIEHQSAWGYYLPVALLLGASGCARYAARHPRAGEFRRRSTRSHLARLLGYWFLIAFTLVGLLAMAWRDSTRYSVWPLVTVPFLSVWTLQWLRRRWARANAPRTNDGKPKTPIVEWGRAG